MTDTNSAPKTVKTSGKAAHLAACAAAKVQGDARRADKKAAGLARQAEYLAGLKSAAATNKARRVAEHEARNASAKATALAMKAKNDDAVDTDVAA